MKIQHTGLTKLSWGLFIAVMVMVAVLYVLLGVAGQTNVYQSRTENELVSVQEWTCVEREDDATPIGIKNEYTFRLPEQIKPDTYLGFYTVHQYVEVFLDGECLYRLKPSSHPIIAKTMGSNWVMIPVYREDAGKEICIEITPVYASFRNREVEFLLGSGIAIYKDRLEKDLPQLILGGMAVLVGLIFICVSAYHVIKRHRGKGIIFLGVFAIMLGIWRLTDTRFTPFMFPKQSTLLYYISVTMLMLGMVPLMKWVEEYFMEKSRRILHIYNAAAIILCLLQLGLQFMGICDIREILLITHVAIVIGVALIIGIVIYEKIVYPDKNGATLGNRLLFLCGVGVVADVAAYYIKGNSSGLLFTLLSFLLYIVFMGIATLYHYSEQEIRLAEQERELAEQERRLAEQERSLTDSRIKAMMSQIRAHFIFNVLATISTYCKIDPKKADNALIRFSRYLRKNINIIEQDGLIDFDMELEQVEDYIALEQLRFPESVVFEKDIQTSSFQIPPLTIQPLVENAIKHGLVGKGKNGTIRLTTRRLQDCIEITVTDDGAGFDVTSGTTKDSVGIRNVRYRLKSMSEGTLTIDSTPGEGTIATIRLPF